MPDPPLWSLLICTVESRRDLLAALLDVLLPQCEADGRVEVIGCHDAGHPHGGAPVGTKRQALLDAAAGEYVSYVDDDDMVEPDFVAACAQAMDAAPDFVAFEHHYYVDGHLDARVVTGLQYPEPADLAPAPGGGPPILVRPVTHINPVRRALTSQVRFPAMAGAGEDRDWVLQVWPRLHTQADAGRVLYHYRHRSGDSVQRTLGPPCGLPRLQVDSPCFRWIGAPA